MDAHGPSWPGGASQAGYLHTSSRISSMMELASPVVSSRSLWTPFGVGCSTLRLPSHAETPRARIAPRWSAYQFVHARLGSAGEAERLGTRDDEELAGCPCDDRAPGSSTTHRRSSPISSRPAARRPAAAD